MGNSNNKVNVFLDESGKNKNEISLIGALLLPADYYNNEKISNLNDRLRREEIKLHFTSFKKSDSPLYKEVLEAFLEKIDYLKFNVVTFKRNSHFNANLNMQSSYDDMIYSKIPERVLYGVLREFGNFSSVGATVYIEESAEYQKRKLHKVVKNQLNVHSLYRNENFRVDTAMLIPKNKHIGVEATDTILGILRVIIENADAVKDGEIKTKTLWNKKSFISEMIPTIEVFLRGINYFELEGQQVLRPKSIDGYLNMFLSKYEKEFRSLMLDDEKFGVPSVS
ncbi:hypothetical protein BS467_19595 (plasmid) [Bacillus altitudinis]|uniref:DUF3800 domain-containing protein n=1 Tax=Bacillus TaxID=1386 RepID=UPI00093840C8|nr:DUF3800 domain-containing protein [Bacillus altitudinis]APP17979.1 hypothetical protein BS467_19595 [Bacillus altitudinis]